MRELLTIGWLLFLSVPAWAGLIVIDENGSGIVNGAAIIGLLANDPGPGGRPSILTYRLPFPGVPGDVLLNDSPIFDVVRFNGDGTVLFYSDNVAPALHEYRYNPRVRAGGYERGHVHAIAEPTGI